MGRESIDGALAVLASRIRLVDPDVWPMAGMDAGQAISRAVLGSLDRGNPSRGLSPVPGWEPGVREFTERYHPHGFGQCGLLGRGGLDGHSVPTYRPVCDHRGDRLSIPGE